MTSPVLEPVRPIFRALATTIVPDAARLDERAWGDVERIIESALATRPARMRRQLALFVRALELIPIPRHGRRFTSLDAERRARVLRAVQDSPLLLLRRGFWGLRTLVYMGYYARPEGASATGYRAHPHGWEARQ